MKSRTDEIFATVDIDKQEDAFINLCHRLEEELNQLQERYSELESITNELKEYRIMAKELLRWK